MTDEFKSHDANKLHADALKLMNETEYIGESYRLLETMRGLSNNQNATIPTANMDDRTYVFMTRPMMDLSDANVLRERRTVGLSTKSDVGLHRYVRYLLDARAGLLGNPSHQLLDVNSPFINVFSNALETMSGWGDEVLESWASPVGNFKEQWGYVNGYNKIYNTFNLDMTFTNIEGGAIPLIIDTWMDYMANVFVGNFIPSTQAIISREIDYMSAIYVINVDEANRVKSIARTIGYPIASPKGELFNYERKKNKRGIGTTYATRFKCYGAEYNDPILLYEFNKVMAIMNPGIRALMNEEPSSLIEADFKYYKQVNYNGYPLIDLKYNTLEYLVDKDKFKIIKERKYDYGDKNR